MTYIVRARAYFSKKKKREGQQRRNGRLAQEGKTGEEKESTHVGQKLTPHDRRPKRE